MDNEKLFNEAYELGCLTNVIDEIPINEFLEMLSEKQININFMTAYAHCCKILGKTQYLKCGKHFIEKINNETISAIFLVAVGLIDDIKDYLINSAFKYIIDYNFKLYIDVILDKYECCNVIGDEHLPIISCLYTDDIRNITYQCNRQWLKTMIKYDINCDKFEDYLLKKHIVNKLIERIKYLQNYPTYWSFIKNKYITYLTDAVYNKIILVRKDEAEILNQYINLFDDNKMSLSPLSFYIDQLNITTKGYLLGISFHIINLEENIVNEKIKLLSDIGHEEYIKTIKTNINEELYANNQNLFSENIDEFSPIDIFSVVCNGKIFRFTRDELEKIVESGKNPYTNLKLNKTIIDNIIGRTFIYKNRLPKSQPLMEIYKQILDNTIYFDIKYRLNNPYL